ncbi:hypothetical protein JWG42_08660 [Desulfoprunum benzoelyticum]|uniref:Putative RNA-binding Zn-ribbon protein involved in translation (DUF1610 family) n=1 Tax=Desulfoprunum benzoelyticum TaxID=1506996 RepID=A0A840UYB2_9BACT|nr:hypothetical protein [Desulfoprunum benzoelyticum]MBB5348444.1 putative RNA-binding Zn-ribbon protein involved in translation (DUF1610 family) [Desulfoprunum benzoelyticum]MBM9530220.1 hypothetical protein [Desulfoprunum benzoelyticum]
MTYTCQNCGVTAKERSKLCNPANEIELENACAVTAEKVCSEKIDEIKFSCDACGSVSASSDNLCVPIEIR